MLVNLEKLFPEAAKVQNLKDQFIETKDITKQWVDFENGHQKIHILTKEEHYIIPHLDNGQIQLTNIRFNDLLRESFIRERSKIDPREFRRHMRDIRNLDKKFRLQFC